MSSASYFLQFDFVMYTAENANSHTHTKKKKRKLFKYYDILFSNQTPKYTSFFYDFKGLQF
jgi:hypothetical protein